MFAKNDKEKIALVTGSAVRVGRAIGLELAARGYDIIAHYLTSEDSAISLAESISQMGRKVWLVKADLQYRDGVDELVESVKKITSCLDLLVNNASFFPEPDILKAKKNILEESWDGWDKAIAVNARAPFFLIQKLSHLLVCSSNPSIVNILDSSVTEAYVSRASHSVSKQALAVISGLAARVVYPPVRVNSLELGRVLFCGDTKDEIFSGHWSDITDVVAGLMMLIEDVTQNGQRLRP